MAMPVKEGMELTPENLLSLQLATQHDGKFEDAEDILAAVREIGDKALVLEGKLAETSLLDMLDLDSGLLAKLQSRKTDQRRTMDSFLQEQIKRLLWLYVNGAT